MMRWTTLVTDCEELLTKPTPDWNGRAQISLSDAFSCLLHHKLSCEEILILTDNQKTLQLAERIHVPAVGLETEGSVHLTGTPYIFQKIGTKDVEVLKRVYERYHKQRVVILETERLCIREMSESDTDNLYHLYHYQDVSKEVSEASLDREELTEFIRSYQKMRYPMYDYGLWILEEKETGRLVGEAGLEEDCHSKVRQKESGIWLEAGYVICPKFRHRGYAAEALQAIVKFAQMGKEYYGFERINCYIRPENIPSARTAKRCGFLKSMEDIRYGQEQNLIQYQFLL